MGRDGECPVRWDPCKPINWWFNPAGARRPASDIARAFAKIAAASGLEFVYRGLTSHTRTTWIDETTVPVDDDLGRGIVVFWSPLTPPGGFGVVGYGGPWWRSRWEQPGTVHPAEILRGFVNLSNNSTVPTDPDTADRYWQDLSLHEIGHAVGLGHVGERLQVMYPSMPQPQKGWLEPGDGEGLRLVGSEQGCIVPVTSPPTTSASARANAAALPADHFTFKEAP